MAQGDGAGQTQGNEERIIAGGAYAVNRIFCEPARIRPRAESRRVERRGGQEGAVFFEQFDAGLGGQVQGPVETIEIVHVDGGHKHAAERAIGALNAAGEADHPIVVHPVAQGSRDEKIVLGGVDLGAEIVPVGDIDLGRGEDAGMDEHLSLPVEKQQGLPLEKTMKLLLQLPMEDFLIEGREVGAV